MIVFVIWVVTFYFLPGADKDSVFIIAKPFTPSLPFITIIFFAYWTIISLKNVGITFFICSS